MANILEVSADVLLQVKVLSAASALENEAETTNPSAAEYLAAMEQKMVSGLICVGWLGFKFNQDSFSNPVNALLLDRNIEGLHRESRMATLPMARQAQRIIYAFHKALTEEKRDLTSGVTGFYTYIPPYRGVQACPLFWLFADKLIFYLVVRGYISDAVTSNLYTDALQQYLQMDIRRLG